MVSYPLQVQLSFRRRMPAVFSRGTAKDRSDGRKAVVNATTLNERGSGVRIFRRYRDSLRSQQDDGFRPWLRSFAVPRLTKRQRNLGDSGNRPLYSRRGNPDA